MTKSKLACCHLSPRDGHCRSLSVVNPSPCGFPGADSKVCALRGLIASAAPCSSRLWMASISCCPTGRFPCWLTLPPCCLLISVVTPGTRQLSGGLERDQSWIFCVGPWKSEWSLGRPSVHNTASLACSVCEEARQGHRDQEVEVTRSHLGDLVPSPSHSLNSCHACAGSRAPQCLGQLLQAGCLQCLWSLRAPRVSESAVWPSGPFPEPSCGPFLWTLLMDPSRGRRRG